MRRAALGLGAVVALVAVVTLVAPPAHAQPEPATCEPGPARYVCRLYEMFLHSPDENEVTYWVEVLTPSDGFEVAREQVTQAMLHGTEGAIEAVANLYHAYLDRAPGPGDDLRYWVDIVATGTHIEDVEIAFLRSGEYNRAGSRGDLIQELYIDLLGRGAREDEVASWDGVALDDISAFMVRSPERRDRIVGDLYHRFTERTALAQEVGFWSDQIAQRGFRLVEAAFAATDEAYRQLSR